jgi:hypothetical protein
MLRQYSVPSQALRKAVFSQLSGPAQTMYAPVWWSITRPPNDLAIILHNGTISCVHTGVRELDITANHV